MAIAADKRPRTEELEYYFKKYPDVPREVIVKEDLLGLGHWFTDAALERTPGSLVKAYRLFSYDLVPMSTMTRQEHRKVPEWFDIFGGIYDLRPLGVQTTLAPDSPYVVDVIDGKLQLTLDGVPICDVSYPPAPRYYSKAFADGTKYDEIIAYGYFVTVFRNCQYWGPQEECRFCDINENARQMKESKDFTLSAPVKPVEYVEEVGKEVGREQLEQEGHPAPVGFLITGGTILNKLHNKSEDEFYAEYVRALKWGGPRRHVTLQTNAKEKETLKWYRGQGLDSHHANMEVWDKRLFEWINPGKNRRIGWEEWVRRMVDSVDVFGEGNVRPNFVAGIEMARPHGFETVEEAVKSTTEGMEFMMSHGVSPRFNHWRREPGSYLVKHNEQPPIPLEYYILLNRHRYELWKKYELPMPHRHNLVPELRYMGATHASYDDYPLLMEAPYFQRPDVRTPEKLVEAARETYPFQGAR